MGLYDDIDTDIKAAFDTDLADAVFDVTITQYQRGTYDPTTGQATQAPINSQVTRGVYTGNWTYEVYNSPVEPLDEMFIMLQSEIDFEPDVSCTIESTERGLSRVLEVRKDPVNATYELRLRF
jgi:hypothetical protein